MTTKEGTCGTKGFKALMVTQFFGALNDNIFKLIVLFLVIRTVVSEDAGTFYMGLVGALFVLPFVIFSPYAGIIADKFKKKKLIVYIKAFEVVLMGLAALFLLTESVAGLLTVLFLMGLQSTFFSPIKFGILPEILKHECLSQGNGYIQFWTFLAIILGTAGASLLLAMAGDSLLLPGLILISFALIGLSFSFHISETSAQSSEIKFRLNPFAEVMRTLIEIRKTRSLFLVVLAITFFWLVGALYQLNIPLYAQVMMGVGELQSGIVLAALAFGIGIGSLGAGYVSNGKVELGLVPLGAIGISICSLLLFFSFNSIFITLVVISLLGISSGAYIVPLDAFLQSESPSHTRGRYIAANNFLNFSGMFISAVLFWMLTDILSFNPAHVFLTFAALTIIVAFLICSILPEVLVRCVNWILTHSFYKVNVRGAEYLPQKGGALLVSNHVSFVDASIISASVDRPVRFLMYRKIYDLPLVNYFARTMKAIPVAGSDSKQAIADSLSAASDRLNDSELICIFAEGAITRTGQLLGFKKGFERIMAGADVPIIPVYLDQVWGSIFSFADGKVLWKVPKEIPYPLSVNFGRPLPSSSKAFEVRQAVQELSSDSFLYRDRKHKVLDRAFLKVAKKRPFKNCLKDSSGVSLRYITTLSTCLTLIKRLKNLTAPRKMVGILLPASVAGALANISLLFSDKIPVNLNFTASPEAVDSAIARCQIQHIITSRLFIKRAGIAEREGMIFVEDLMNEISVVEKAITAVLSLVLPAFVLEKLFIQGKRSSSDIATVMFSSGSTGEPKGVILTHANITSNLESLYDVFQLDRHDGVLGALPFFHSFGMTGTLWMPLLAGIKAVYHPNPLEATTIGKIIRKESLTILMSTPTFLGNYVKKCEKKDFASLKRVIVGAEKLHDKIADTFKEKFGIAPLEGYGCTELSPVAFINIDNYGSGRDFQQGHKPGTAGHPIPGVSAKIVDPNSGLILEPGREGLLFIKGPNVMQGYLDDPEKTSEVIIDGWYNTGDIASLDQDGFVTITDRLSRFSKIGGEMVPHVKIEEELHKALKATEQECVVTSVADEQRGERLVVLHKKSFDTGAILNALKDSGLPNLWLPKKEHFYLVESFPVLGTGKLDLRGIKSLALELQG